MKLIVATQNKDKFKEIKYILGDLSIPIISLNELDKKFNIIEDGKTFRENALKKALPVSKHYKEDYVLGEDSGLEVKFLDGAPGIYAKRYAGANATYQSNNRKLLKELKGVTDKKRGAHFYCCLVLVYNRKLIKLFDGKLVGKIAKETSGRSGFGYDPVFYLTRYKKTVAQLPLTVKNKISHRAKAFGKLKTYFKKDKLFLNAGNQLKARGKVSSPVIARNGMTKQSQPQ